MKTISRTCFFAAAAFFAGIQSAFAHIGVTEHGSFISGFSHPFGGADHILVMVAVGLWASQLGGKAIWAVPAAFVLAMGAGFVLALNGIHVPFVEPAILASVVAIGLLAAMALRLPTGVAMAIVAAFAVFHGHAHGSELGIAGAAGYGLGFALATVILHVIGIAIGLAPRMIGHRVTRIGGVVTALAGLYLAFGA
ncbi:MAG: Urease accessory protein [Candidatus Tokpelaia hoelldobleri]|uniref:Urease accessory protein n=1 Tax=Candidatus Tokpelaia hoelldobleri TaxID=1902579 RepID=A0A1U9JTP0_9HYPH|nr:MAG: Urease accessory protein [Candidatus Tokpelaia hoelldoblerii]